MIFQYEFRSASLKIVRIKYPNKKIVLFGQSFGSAISLTVNRELFDFIALSSPVLEIKETLTSYFGEISLDILSKKEHMYFYMPVYSPIKPVYFKVKTSIIQDAINNFDYLKVASSLKCPVIVFYGKEDERVSRKSIENFMNEIPSFQKQLVEINGGHSAPPLLHTSWLAEKMNSFLSER